MKKIIYLLATLLLVSCEQYLDIKPYGKVVPDSPEEFSALLHTELKKLDEGDVFQEFWGNAKEAQRFETYADNFDAAKTQYPAGNQLSMYVGDELNIKPQLYEKLYQTISKTNMVIDNIKDDGSQLAKDVLGTAYAMRGYCYYQLLRQFAVAFGPKSNGIGLPLVTTFDMEERPIRSSAQATAELIESDLKKAISYDIQSPVYRFNSDVANGLLARLYFWTGQYEKAAEVSKALLDKYPLLDGDAYKEMIASKLDMKGNVIFKAGIFSNPDTELSNAVEELKARPVSDAFYALFAEKEKDVRFELTFDKNKNFVKPLTFSMRSAEFALILAESYYHLGQSDQALAMLNEFRAKRIADVTPYTVDNLPEVDATGWIKTDAKGNAITPLLQAILNERRKEFFLENGDRWFELKRNGSPEMMVIQRGLRITTYPWMYTFPLPPSDLDLVDGLIQNEGYDKLN